mgnify:CR=1 FL=1
MPEQEKNIHKGHRQKVKNRYIETGFDGMADHNILELLLFFGIPYKDTNPIAHELMDTFGSFSGVLKASVSELKSVKGMTENAACLINMVLPLYARYSQDVKTEKLSMDTDAIVEYMRPKFLDTPNERVYAMCFDNNRCLITVRKLSDGDVNSTLFDMRKLASAVLETKAAAVVLVHNHPNGIPLPSQEDIAQTKYAYDLLQSLKVQLLDHIILADEGKCSMVSFPKFSHLFYGLDPLV